MGFIQSVGRAYKQKLRFPGRNFASKLQLRGTALVSSLLASPVHFRLDMSPHTVPHLARSQHIPKSLWTY